MTFVKQLLEQNFPHLKRKMLMAKIDEKPEEYLKKKLVASLYVAVGMGVLTFMFADRMEISLLIVPVSMILWFVIVFWVMVKSVDSQINKRRKEIDKDVLFAGRFLLVKLNSGKSLVNALDDASSSYGVANTYFKEIMKDIQMGTPLEQALEKATTTCPSDKLKKILFQITNALKIGIDVTKIVDSVLDDIAHDQLLEIEAYGKTLSSVALFYMLFAVVMPSLGVSLLIVIASLISLDIGLSAFVIVGFFMIFIEFIFITIFKQIRPDVNL